MLYKLTLILLGPWLWLQGRAVRRDTPKLPEAEGVREGELGKGPPLSILLTGDSAAAGVGVEWQSEALSGRLMQALSEHFSLRWKLVAETGLDSSGLLQCLQRQQGFVFDVVIVCVGVNDVTGMQKSRRWIANLHSLVNLSARNFGASTVILCAVPPMHRFTALPQPLRWWLGLRAAQLRRLMRNVAADYECCVYADMPVASEANLLASDGFHPGADAYRQWADRLLGLVLAACEKTDRSIEH